MNLRRLGGLSALVLAAAYVVGLVLNFTLLDTSSIANLVDKVSFVAGKQTIFHVWIFFTYVVFGVMLVFLAQALDEQLRPAAPALARTATAFALIWAGLLIAAGNVYIAGLNTISGAIAQDPAQAATAWLAIDSVHQGLSGTAEIPGGLWTLLVSLAALKATQFPRALSYVGIATGVAGLLTAIPVVLMPAVAVYALGHCTWWVWLAVLLLRKGASDTAHGRYASAPSLSPQ